MILEEILASKRDEIRKRQASVPIAALERLAAAAPVPLDFAGALGGGGGADSNNSGRRRHGGGGAESTSYGKLGHREGGIRLIAEFKRASPSRGAIRADLDPAQVGRRYEAAGAAAISVLTDAPFFHGSPEDLRSLRSAVKIPLLQKDFILDAWQLLEARSLGADGILLIVAALPDDALARLHRAAAGLGLAALVEVHDEADLERALAVRPRIVGINNRDLRTFEVSLATTFRLRPMIPSGIIVVGESGIHSRADALKLQEAGVDAMLVGESLMRRPDPGKAAAELLGREEL